MNINLTLDCKEHIDGPISYIISRDEQTTSFSKMMLTCEPQQTLQRLQVIHS